MAMTTYLSDKLLDHVLKNVAYTSPTTVYLALFTTATTDAGGGTEVTGGSYARQPVTFATAAAKDTKNSVAVIFTNLPTAVILDGAIMDALAGGNMLTHGPLVATLSPTAGDSITFAINTIDEAFN